jgi:cytochrome b involved in lipid metabolism
MIKMKNMIPIIGVVVVIVIVAAVLLMQPGETTKPVPTTELTDKPPADETITLVEIASHSTAEDCWFAINGKVYDVTEFIAGGKHPGGAAVVQGCGMDATELFETRPMGSGTPHSDTARGWLENYYIADLG